MVRGVVAERGVGSKGVVVWTYAVRICLPECSAARLAAALEIVPDANSPNPMKRKFHATACIAPDCALPRVLFALAT